MKEKTRKYELFIRYEYPFSVDEKTKPAIFRCPACFNRSSQTRRETLLLCRKILIEFWAVATRPITSNGLGLKFVKTEYEVRKFKRLFTVYDDIPNIFAEWVNLVLKHNVSGKNVHDTRLVAAMLTHNITHLLTFNGKDFKRFSEITTVDPQNVK